MSGRGSISSATMAGLLWSASFDPFGGAQRGGKRWGLSVTFEEIQCCKVALGIESP